MTPSFVPGHASADLPPGQIHVWLAHPDLLGHGQLEARHLHLLSAAERARHQALRFARDRHHYLAAHALARRVLASHTGIAPDQLDFSQDAKGKPHPVLPAACGAIGYNLSHTDGLVACVLARDAACGIDVEVRRPLDDLMALAATVFSPRELRELAACAPDARQTRFYTLWTLKEAYAKATGDGIAADLSHVSFVPDGDTVAAHFDPGHPGQRAPWRFFAAAAGDRHRLAVAVLPVQVDPAAPAPALVQQVFQL